jgi:1-acyl-sn-glycerol-3-phosphate acyltransferase
MHTTTPGDPGRRDPRLIAKLTPLVRAVNSYFATEVREWNRLPAEGPFLVVGNHSGGAETVDLAFLLGPWLAERGPKAPLYALAYDLLFNYPVVGSLFPQLGILPASRENAQRAFAGRGVVVVFPGGDYEVFRAWSRRNRIDFGGHTGFVETALECGVPVVPMTIHGAHQSTFVLTRGRRIARRTGLASWLHVNVFPIVWNIPFGPAPAFVPSLTLPSKVSVEIGEPLDWTRFGPDAAHDPVIVRRCYDEITTRMQATLDRLAAETPHPILSRVAALRRCVPGPRTLSACPERPAPAPAPRTPPPGSARSPA